jgi:hypothetical protein
MHFTMTCLDRDPSWPSGSNRSPMNNGCQHANTEHAAEIVFDLLKRTVPDDGDG